ncbi:MAG: PadR family transcriptional regulator [Actinomycetota bacterium]|nr:PadR family transcriptional regulator [Actinomycetota bacterium]
MKSETSKGHLDLLLLAALRDGPAHGYAVISSLKRRSEGAFDLQEGTIYPALHRLESSGMIGSEWSVENGRRRRVYSLTRDGRRVLEEKTSAWRSFSRAMTGALEPAT